MPRYNTHVLTFQYRLKYLFLKAIMSKYHYFMLYKYNPSSLIYNEIDCIYIYMCKDFNENKNKNHNFVSEK